MKVALVVLLVAAFAGAEFYHEFVRSDLPAAAMCVAPHTQQEAIRETLLDHLRSH